MHGRKPPLKTATSATTRGKVATPAPPASLPRLRKLTSIEGLLAEMRSVYRSCRAGVLPPATGTRLVYILQVMAQLTETATLEKRITAMEEKVKTHEERITPVRLVR
ncbi:MAG: hypothetical protein IPJ48_11520 [Propionivibrio sp.]|uniref:Uncharacterized protein n=1 Tax=Candidatus Propionivibrio dominans TaxID=2954373 RepID=A0A9D7F7W8_9RHOO|nr:hypothetical protein [Candidatus Propionivibrio dominans]